MIRELEYVLSEEQNCLLTGDYGGLANLAERKTLLAERLEADSASLDADDCRRVADQAAHNEALLRSAQRGIQAAITQIGQFKSGEHQSTYSAGGQRRPLSRNPSVVQKL